MKSRMLKRIFVGLFVAPMAWAANADTNQPAVTQVTLRLADGGRITGKPVSAALIFHTEYAKTEIPWNAVTECEVSSNAPSVLKLKNGDQLRGRIGVDVLKLETSLGKQTVPLTSVTGFQVRTSRTGGGMEGLMLYFSFDEDAGAVVHDASGNGNDGKVLGAKWTPDGRIGGAYVFHGKPRRAGDCIQVPDSPSLNSPCEVKQITLAAWIKPVSIPSDFPIVLDKGGNQRSASWGGYELYLNRVGDNDVGFSSGGFNFYTHNANGKWINNHLGVWIHIVVTVDPQAGKRCSYVNGIHTADEYDDLFPNCTIADALETNSNDLYIGKPDPRDHPNRAGFDGAIDEVMIFNRALSAEEVQLLYQREGPLTAGAAETKPAAGKNAAAIKVRAELVDGSILEGEVELEELTVQSASLGKVAAPLAQLRELKFTEDGKKVSVKMQNGDLLVGAPLFRELNVTTTFGRVTLLPAHLRLVSSGITKPPETKSPLPPHEPPAPRRERTRIIEL